MHHIFSKIIVWIIVIFNIDQNNQDYDFFSSHNRSALRHTVYPWKRSRPCCNMPVTCCNLPASPSAECLARAHRSLLLRSGRPRRGALPPSPELCLAAVVLVRAGAVTCTRVLADVTEGYGMFQGLPWWLPVCRYGYIASPHAASCTVSGPWLYDGCMIYNGG